VAGGGLADGLHGERAVEQHQVGVGRADVDAIGFQGHAVGGLDHPHVGGAAQQGRQHALVAGVQMLDEHEGQAIGDRQGFQQFLERLEAVGGGTDADDHGWRTAGRLLFSGGFRWRRLRWLGRVIGVLICHHSFVFRDGWDRRMGKPIGGIL
jgi:hypothetical protein